MNVEESCKILCTMPYKKEELSQFKSKVAPPQLPPLPSTLRARPIVYIQACTS